MRFLLVLLLLVTISPALRAQETNLVQVTPNPVVWTRIFPFDTAKAPVVIFNNSHTYLIGHITNPREPFALLSDSMFALASGARDTVIIRYLPTDIQGSRATDSVFVVTNLGPPNTLVVLSGDGRNYNSGSITLSPDSLMFDSLLIGGADTLFATARNGGSSNLTVSAQIMHSVHGGGAFTIYGASSKNIPGHQSLPILVQFRPTSVGIFDDTLRLQTNDLSNPTLKVPLHGVAYDIPRVALSSEMVQFNAVTVGAKKTAQVVLRNSSESAALNFSLIHLPALPYSLTFNPPGSSLTPGESDTLTVSFQPSVVGAYTDSIILTTNARPPDDRVVIPLLGSGIASSVSEMDMSEGTTLTSLLDDESKTLEVNLVLPETRKIRLVLFDAVGVERGEVFSGIARAGTNNFRFAICNLTSGIYFIRLEGAGESVTSKIWLRH